MKKTKLIFLFLALLISSIGAYAGPFVDGQVLPAWQLNQVVDAKTNNAYAAITGGTITGTSIYGPTSIAVTAAGTTQGTATSLTTPINKVTTNPVGGGVLLYAPLQAGFHAEINNATANALKVYPQVGGSIGALGTNAPIIIPAGGSVVLISADTLVWDAYLSPDQIFTTVTATTNINTAAINNGQLAGYRNRAINSGFPVSQIYGSTAQTVPFGNGATAASWFGSASTASQVYFVDGFYTLVAGTGNATQQRIAGAAQDQWKEQITGSAGITSISFGQRIETANSYDLNGTTASFSVELANSLLTSVTWTAYYANTADTWGIVGAYTRTQIATGTCTVSVTLSTCATQIAIPAAATTGIEIVLTVGAQTSGTWTIGEWQVEPGSIATAFEFARYDDQLRWSQNFTRKICGVVQFDCTVAGIASAAAQAGVMAYSFPNMRSIPNASVVGTWTVANTAQPTLIGVNQSSVHLLIVSVAAGAMQANTTGTSTYILLQSLL